MDETEKCEVEGAELKPDQREFAEKNELMVR